MTHDQPDGECRFHVHYRLADGEADNPPTVARPDFHLRYWYTCTCGDVGPLRSNDSAAAEDGCDHAYPGWRDMPVMRECPSWEGPRAALAWVAEVRRVYPPAWLDRQGPVREYRRPGLMRHVPGGAPGGGYLVGVAKARPATAPTTARRSPSADDCEQHALF